MRSLIIAIISFVTLTATGCDFSRDNATGTDVVVLGDFHTLDPNQPRAEAIAIADGRFSFVGAENKARALIGPQTDVIELGSAVAYPGLIDAHVHIAGIGSAMRSVDLTGAESYEQLVARVKARANVTRRGATLLGRGWHQSKWLQAPEGSVDGFPTHHALSAAVPDHPVLLEHANGHSVLLNKKAMDQLGISSSSISPEGGVIVFRDGQPTGLLHETAIDLTQPLQRYDIDTAIELVDLAQQHLLSQGITTAHDAGALQVDIQAQKTMAERGDLLLRLYTMVAASDTLALREWLRSGPQINIGDHRLSIRSLKIQADGALGSRTAWLHAPYTDAPDTSGVLTYDLTTLSTLIEQTRADNWQINVHAIGDRANSEVLNVFAPFTQRLIDHRFRIEHAQHLAPEDASRFADLGVIASMQPIHLSSDRPWAIDRLGRQRIEEGAYIWQELLDKGVVVASGTDAPVEPVNPIANFYAAVTRKTLSGLPAEGFEPGQRLTRREALFAMTMAAAYAAFEEIEKGSIEVGKLADLTVLSHDILEIPEDQILDTEVVMTLIGGKVVYRQADP
jgi:predicted amidohydrolase YtcJ